MTFLLTHPVTEDEFMLKPSISSLPAFQKEKLAKDFKSLHIIFKHLEKTLVSYEEATSAPYNDTVLKSVMLLKNIEDFKLFNNRAASLVTCAFSNCLDSILSLEAFILQGLDSSAAKYKIAIFSSTIACVWKKTSYNSFSKNIYLPSAFSDVVNKKDYATALESALLAWANTFSLSIFEVYESSVFTEEEWLSFSIKAYESFHECFASSLLLAHQKTSSRRAFTKELTTFIQKYSFGVCNELFSELVSYLPFSTIIELKKPDKYCSTSWLLFSGIKERDISKSYTLSKLSKNHDAANSVLLSSNAYSLGVYAEELLLLAFLVSKDKLKSNYLLHLPATLFGALTSFETFQLESKQEVLVEHLPKSLLNVISLLWQEGTSRVFSDNLSYLLQAAAKL